jgi:hypothetical protein
MARRSKRHRALRESAMSATVRPGDRVADAALEALKAERDRYRDECERMRRRTMIAPAHWERAVAETLDALDVGVLLIADRQRVAAALVGLIGCWQAPEPPKSEQDWYAVSREQILELRSLVERKTAETGRWRSAATIAESEQALLRRQLDEERQRVTSLNATVMEQARRLEAVARICSVDPHSHRTPELVALGYGRQCGYCGYSVAQKAIMQELVCSQPRDAERGGS